MSRLVISFSEPERKALSAVARQELRPMRDQVRLIVRRDLEQRGLLPADGDPRDAMEARQTDDTRNRQ